MEFSRRCASLLRAIAIYFPLMIGIGGLGLATTPVVNVISPLNGSTDSSPVHYVATASSPGCASGIAAMRVYSAPQQGVFTEAGASLDANITLAAGTYSTVVQAWDNCGGVGKTTVNITVSNVVASKARFLYMTEYTTGKIAGFVVNPSTGALTPTGQTNAWAHWGPVRVASDKGGYRLYVVNEGSHDLNGYFIDRNNGYLYPVPGSPVAIAGTGAGVAVTPSGHFVYAISSARKGGTDGVNGFAVQSDGSLKAVAGSAAGLSAEPIAIAIDPKGRFLYVSNQAGLVDAYAISGVDGSLTPVAGSPFPAPVPNSNQCFLCGLPYLADLVVDGSGHYLLAPDQDNGTMLVFAINQTNGALTNAPGSPFIDLVPSSPTAPGSQPASVAYNAQTNEVFASTNYFLGSGGAIPAAITGWKFDPTTGSLTRISHAVNPGSSSSGAPTSCNQGLMRFDPSGSYLYGAAYDCGGTLPLGEGEVIGWGVNSSGSPSLLPGFPIDLGYVENQPRNGIAVTP